MSAQLNIHDVNNLLKLVARSRFDGIEEAEVAVALKYKLQAIGQELVRLPEVVEADEKPED